ncbi:MAG TPA: hypothetical protein VJX67_11855, partial [Blastocatellia bacterium]|nr:hypothetical protein [Blastocatellia bacterium]
MSQCFALPGSGEARVDFRLTGKVYMINRKAAPDAGRDAGSTEEEKLDSWKEIAAYLDREVRTVQRWEKQEGLPVHRHHHDKLGTVYAYRAELNAWLKSRQPQAAESKSPEVSEGGTPETGTREQAMQAREEAGGADSIERPGPDGSVVALRARPTGRTRLILGVLAVLSVLCAGGLVVRSILHGRAVTRSLTTAGANPAAVTVAILPFRNIATETGPDWFSEGLSEELTVQLERLQPARLRVIGRTTAGLLGSGAKSLDDAGLELGLDYVLEGTVRREDDNVRITAQLVQLKHHTAIWAEVYDRTSRKAISVETDIGLRIAQAVSARLVGGGTLSMVEGVTGNTAAAEAYAKGRYAWHKGTETDLRKSLEFFEQARELDPAFPRAYSGIAEAYVALANNGIDPPKDCFPKAQEAAQKALELDDSLAEAHVALAQVKCHWNWDWAGAEREFLKALDLAPGLATAHHAYAHFLSEMGRHTQAIAEVKRAQELEPLSAAINSDAGWFYFRARRYDEAIAECRKVLDMEPGFRSSESCIIDSLIKKGMFEQARSEARGFLAARGQTAPPGLDAPDPERALASLELGSIEMMKGLQTTR